MGNPPGRPFITIDWRKVDNLILAQCNCEEVAGELGIHPDTLVNRIQEIDGGIYSGFSAYAASKKSSGKARLRATQFTEALNGNTRMLDKLGDIYLGQGKEQENNPPNEALLDTINQLITDLKTAKNENLSLKEQLDAIKSQANPVVQRIDEEIQHMDRGDPSGENPYLNPEVRLPS